MSNPSFQNNNKHLVLGGARSGKSRFAEGLVKNLLEDNNTLTREPIYLATAQANDKEMQKRIESHQQDRSKIGISWQVIEEPIDIAQAIKTLKKTDIVLIECLTLWLSNCIHHEVWPQQKKLFLEVLDQSETHVILVGNEVGQGITPMNSLAREFIDEAGRLHQQLAKCCHHVSFVTAGIAQQLK